MNIHTILQILFIPLLVISGITIFQKYKKGSGIFFLLFIGCLLVWLCLVPITFRSNLGAETLTILNRLAYWVSLFGLYSVICFYLFFGKSQKVVMVSFYYFCTFFLAILPVFINSPHILKKIVYINDKGVYREIYGDYYSFISFFYFLVPFVLLIASFIVIRNQNYINKARLLFLSWGFVISAFLSITFIQLLPLLGIYSFEGEIMVFLIPFMVSIAYAVNNYVFISSRKILYVVFNTGVSGIIALFFSLILKYFFIVISEENFWSISIDSGVFDITMYTIFFALINPYVRKLFSTSKEAFDDLYKIQNQIPYTTNVEDMSNLIASEFKKLFLIEGVYVRYFGEKFEDEIPHLFNFFLKSKNKKFFFNDLVFIEELVPFGLKNKLCKEILPHDYLIIPISKKGKLVGYINFGKRIFGNYYSSEEVLVLQKFTRFIEGHLKYIDIYSEIHDLNLNLEKRVDEKTIQYNTIINQQKEFIEVVSHEIRTPLATALFQTECLEDEIRELTFTKKRRIIGEVKALYNKITDTVTLVNKLFSIERFENNKVQLYKENTDIGKMIEIQVQSFIKMHKEIDFAFVRGKDLGFMDIDVVQFRQVIDNLVANAIKFTSKVQSPKISIRLVKKKNHIVFTIEDSGIGFSGIDISNLFEKYNTGNSSSIGLGMGLYLCKKIVELHGGKISAGRSEKFGGALFKIVIPVFKSLKNNHYVYEYAYHRGGGIFGRVHEEVFKKKMNG